jgi:drug/metabolite transporter (DMT)-like permease
MPILLLPLIAAVLHATWNALVKTSGDRLVMLAAITLVTAIAGALALPFVHPPSVESWPLIVLSAFLKYSYLAFVFYAYRAGDLSIVYPLARGSAPLLVTAGAAFFAGEMLSWQAQIGVVVVCLGIFSLSIGHMRSLHGGILPLVLALGTGLNIAAYTLCDGIGARMSGSPFGFIAWAFILEFPVVLFVMFRRRWKWAETFQANWKQGLGVGLCSVVAYTLVIYAAVHAPLSLVSALRETSVIFAAVIGTVMMGERPWQERVLASAIVAFGVVLMTAFRA